MEQHSTTLTEQQKRNMLVGTVESNQQQPVGTLEDPNQLNNEPQMPKAHLELNNGNNLQKHQALQIQSTRERSNIPILSDTQNHTKMVSLNNKVCQS